MSVTPELFIENQIRAHCYGEYHPLADKYAKKIIDDVIRRYKNSDYMNLDDMIQHAMDLVEENTKVIAFLAHGGTSAQFADMANMSVATARKYLNKSPYAAAVKSRRPYLWSLRNEEPA